MIVSGIPIQASQIHKVIYGWLKDAFIFSSKSHKANLSLVYFSYQPDFEYLMLSIRSALVHARLLNNIYLFVDQKAPFNAEQERQLKSLYPNIIFHQVNNFAWGSVKSTKAEFDCFLKVAEKEKPEDYLVKVDSDILFMQGTRLAKVAASGRASIGDRHHLRYRYYQGGMYFIKNKYVKQCFENISEQEIEDIFNDWGGTVGEDLAVYQRLKDKKVQTTDTRLMLFPDEYKKINKPNAFLNWEFVALHFVRDKENMPYYFKYFINK